MKALITGGAGFIGSALVRRAVRDGHHVLNVDKLTYAANLASVSEVADQPNYRFVEADICDAASVKAALDSFAPDVVFNLAAETHVDRSIDKPENFIKSNILGVYNLLETIIRYMKKSRKKIKLTHVSTDEVYGDVLSGKSTEKSIHNPSNCILYTSDSADEG